MMPVIEAYGQAYLTAVGMPARLEREWRLASDSNDAQSAPATLGRRVK